MTAVYHYYVSSFKYSFVDDQFIQEDYEMDEDWGLVKNDCLLFSPSLNDDPLLIHPSDSLLSLSKYYIDPFQFDLLEWVYKSTW